MIVDDEPIIRKALKIELNAQGSYIACGMNDDGDIDHRQVTVIDTYPSGIQLMAALDSPLDHPMPDYLLLDMEFQGDPTGGIFIAGKIHKKYPDIKIIILSGRFDNPLPGETNRQERMLEIGRVVFESLESGAQAFVSKNAAGGFSVDNVLRAIESLYTVNPVTGEKMLDWKQMNYRYAEIATALHESDKNIQEHQKDLSRKLDIVNKSGARIAKAIQYGLIDPKEIKYLKR